MQSTENWKAIPGYEGIYEVSDQGRVRSLDRITAKNAFKKGALKKASTVANGYLYVDLYKLGKASKRTVHSLVLEAFIGPAPSGMICCHNNGVRVDNRLENLRWGTYSDNAHDTVRHGTHVQAARTHCPRGHELKAPNLVPSVVRDGRRECLACSRKQSSRRQDFCADAEFERIMTDPTAASHKDKFSCRRGHALFSANIRHRRDHMSCHSCEVAAKWTRDISARFDLSWRVYDALIAGNELDRGMARLVAEGRMPDLWCRRFTPPKQAILALA